MAKRWKTVYDVSREQRAERERLNARLGRTPPPRPRSKTVWDVAREQKVERDRLNARLGRTATPAPRSRTVHEVAREQQAERERVAAVAEIRAGRGEPLDAASLESAQQAAGIASSALNLVSGLMRRR